MPLFETFVIFGLAALFAYLISAFSARLRADLKSQTFWIVIPVLAALASAGSVIANSTRHAGTGFTTSHGWPKPFYFTYLSENGAPATDVEPLYFFGNSLFFAAMLVVAWSAWRCLRR